MSSLQTTCRIACLLCVLVASAARAQQPTGIPLQDLLQRVSVKAPSLLADSAAIGVRQAQQQATRYNWLPSMKLNYQADLGTNNNLPGGYFSYGIVPGNSKTQEFGTSSTILTDLGIAAFDWEFYNFGAYGAQQKVAASDVSVEQHRFAQSRYQLQAYTIQAYLQLLRFQDMLAIQQLNIDRNAEIMRTIRSLAVSGVKAGVDTSIAEAELSKSRLTYIELGNQAKQLRIQLSYLSGLPAEQLVADSSMEQSLLKDYAAAWNDVADTAHHPLIEYYKSLYENSLQREVMVRKSFNPKLSLDAAAWGRGSSLTATNEYKALPAGFGFERTNYLVGVGITYDLFNIKRRQLQVHTQKAATLLAQQQLAAQQAGLAAGISEANTELATARDRLSEIPHQLKAAQAAYRQKLSLYRNGLTDIIELNVALNVLYRAETDLTTAKYMYCAALFQKALTENQVDTLLQSLK